MTHVELAWSDARRNPRIDLPLGLLSVSTPPPKVFNWFTDTRHLNVMNIFDSGLAICSNKPCHGELILRLALPAGENYLICGQICHHYTHEQAYVYGVDCAEQHSQLTELFQECLRLN